MKTNLFSSKVPSSCMKIYRYLNIGCQSHPTINYWRIGIYFVKMDKEFQEESVKKLREIEELVLKEQEDLENKISLEVESAKENNNSNKEAALAAWKRKKLYGEQILEVDSALTRMEILREFLSSGGEGDASSNGYGAASPDNMRRGVEDIEAEVSATVREVSKQLDKWRENKLSISKDSSFGSFDVEELMKELEDLQVEELDGEDAPTKSSNLEDDAELAKLQSWAE